MSSIEEFDQLLRDRFDLDRDALLSALRTLPPQRRGSGRLTAAEAGLLDAAGMTEGPNT